MGQNSRFPKDKNDEIIAIVAMSGQEQEFIDIPKKIKEKKVTHIGYAETPLIGPNHNYRIESPNLKKVYIHDNILDFSSEAFGSIDGLCIMVCGAMDTLVGDVVRGNIYI